MNNQIWKQVYIQVRNGSWEQICSQIRNIVQIQLENRIISPALHHVWHQIKIDLMEIADE